jgi:hypothetical protein
MICGDLRENRKRGWKVRRTNQPAAPTRNVRVKCIPIICLKELVLIEQALILNTRLLLRIAYGVPLLCADRPKTLRIQPANSQLGYRRPRFIGSPSFQCNNIR